MDFGEEEIELIVIHFGFKIYFPCFLFRLDYFSFFVNVPSIFVDTEFHLIFV